MTQEEKFRKDFDDMMMGIVSEAKAESEDEQKQQAEDMDTQVEDIFTGKDDFKKVLNKQRGITTVEKLNSLLSCLCNSTVLSTNSPKLPFIIKINTLDREYAKGPAHENLQNEIENKKPIGDYVIYYTEVYQYYPSLFNTTDDLKPGFCAISKGFLDNKGDLTVDEAYGFCVAILRSITANIYKENQSDLQQIITKGWNLSEDSVFPAVATYNPKKQ